MPEQSVCQFHHATLHWRCCVVINLCFQIRASINDKVEMRSFTPIRFDGGICELFYRVYPEPEGVMSRHLQSLQEDDRLEIMGPVGDPNLKHQVIKSGLTAFSASRAHVSCCAVCWR